MSFWFAGGMAVMAGAGAYMDGKASNAQAENSQNNTRRRYALKSNNAKNQMEEQKSLAMEKMTETTRKFLLTKGTMATVQAESMVGGNVAKRIAHKNRREMNEEKGQIAKVTNSNIVNIAQNMLAEKVDTEAMLMEAESRKKSSGQIMLDMGIAAGSTFISAGGASGFAKSGIKKGNTGVKNG